MKRTIFLNAALSSLMLVGSLAGCSNASSATRPNVSADAAPSNKQAVKAGLKAEAALANHKAEAAVTQAEIAVAAQPDSAAYRALLGRAYLAAGRYASSEAAFADAVSLGQSDARTIVSLALVQVAGGKSAAAREMLSSHASTLPVADYGLALALAGDTGEGVRVLLDGLRNPQADAKLRQNLAYAYALDGRWREAKIMANQDLPPEAADKRITDWALTARSGMEAQRVAALIGVNPVSDAGLPSRLALAPAPVATPEAAPVQTAEAPTAAVPPAIAPVAETSTQVEQRPAAPARFAMIQPIPAQEPTPTVKPARLSRAIKPAAEQAARPAKPVAAPLPVASSRFVVQLGAYDSAAIAQDSWSGIAARNPRVADYPLVNSTTTVNGKTFHRLAISGFGKQDDAVRLCATLRSTGKSCFVRSQLKVDAPVRWAVNGQKKRQFASR